MFREKRSAELLVFAAAATRGVEPEDLLAAADRALYEARSARGTQVVIAAPDEARSAATGERDHRAAPRLLPWGLHGHDQGA